MQTFRQTPIAGKMWNERASKLLPKCCHSVTQNWKSYGFVHDNNLSINGSNVFDNCGKMYDQRRKRCSDTFQQMSLNLFFATPTHICFKPYWESLRESWLERLNMLMLLEQLLLLKLGTTLNWRTCPRLPQSHFPAALFHFIGLNKSVPGSSWFENILQRRLSRFWLPIYACHNERATSTL